MKRLLDIMVSASALLLFLPFGLLIAMILRLTGEGEIFYRQERVGKDGKTFGLFKFVTMLKDSPNIGTGTVTLKNDPRVLPFGRFLRKAKLNEVPQLLNVLKGDMGLVGWRPLTPPTFRMYPPDVQKKIVRLRPGLTGVGSIVFRDEETILDKSPKPSLVCYREDIMPCKGRLELWYQENRSFGLDVKILFLTAVVVLAPHSTLYRDLLPGLPATAAPAGLPQRPVAAPSASRSGAGA